MRVLLKEDVLVLIPETSREEAEITTWKSSRGDQVFCLRASKNPSAELHQLGPRVEACREPINVVSDSVDPDARLISNFAATSFDLDGRHYRSVESFWQGLKFPDERDRARVAELEGPQARAEGERQGYGTTIAYGGQDIVVGTSAHWRLMERACRAKFEQNAEARAALLATGSRPLTHVVRRDSPTIPGAIMAQIWMRIRKRMKNSEANGGKNSDAP
jgi:predicted NAD-dependent protein-ADP-ribosyltransferase YbiA (DUF1768 family)